MQSSPLPSWNPGLAVYWANYSTSCVVARFSCVLLGSRAANNNIINNIPAEFGVNVALEAINLSQAKGLRSRLKGIKIRLGAMVLLNYKSQEQDTEDKDLQKRGHRAKIQVSEHDLEGNELSESKVGARRRSLSAVNGGFAR